MQPQYGPPQYGPPYGPPPKRGNGFAVAGVCLFIIPILGLIFSIIGLAQSGVRRSGRALSIVGIILSLAAGGAGTAVAVNRLAHSTAADPGCISAESASRQMETALNADGAKLSQDSSNPTAARTDMQKFLTDMQSLNDKLSSAHAQAQHDSVKTQIAALSGDISTFNSDLQAIAGGDTSRASQIQTDANTLQTDANALDRTCTTL
ncbi:MAG: DUF4190 domain-containing protein [Actinobacteria bacterium]|nr:DUF4190 domain-containing protein [Actinomycetota bacterium]